MKGDHTIDSILKFLRRSGEGGRKNKEKADSSERQGIEGEEANDAEKRQ